MIRRPPRSTQSRSSAASDVYKRQALVALEDDRVGAPEELRTDRLADDAPDLLRRRPQLVEHHRPPVAVPPDGLVRQVDVDPAGQGERDDERRRREIARAHERVDPALEVAVAGQDGGDDEVVRLDRLRDRLLERPRIADAGRAAVADEGESCLLYTSPSP